MSKFSVVSVWIRVDSYNQHIILLLTDLKPYEEHITFKKSIENKCKLTKFINQR